MLVGGGGQFPAQQVLAETHPCPPGQSSGAKFLMSDKPQDARS